MNKKIMLFLIIFTIISISSTVVSASILDNNSNIKTHEFNYGNKATFNLSDNLTEKTGAESISFWMVFLMIILMEILFVILRQYLIMEVVMK